jgi:hypothetical protein
MNARDLMVLQAVRSHWLMSELEVQRAHELAEQGLIDTAGTWKLTEQGARELSAAGSKAAAWS